MTLDRAAPWSSVARCPAQIYRRVSGPAHAERVVRADRLGRIFRAVRQRLRLRQIDVAGRAGVSAAAISRIERGRLGEVSHSTLWRVADALEIRLDMVARWRGGELDRMLNAKHAALAEDVSAWLLGLGGWEVRPEVTFSEYGERGIVDLLAWHAATRSLLVIELKTELVDVGELLGTFDRKRRLAARIAAGIGWQPLVVGAALLLRGTRTNQRRVADHTRSIRAALPDDGRRLRAWLKNPAGPMAALAFVPDRQRASARQVPATNRRVRIGRQPSQAAAASVTATPGAVGG
jgi:transcriptional regulator with XRE-family HTH domain